MVLGYILFKERNSSEWLSFFKCLIQQLDLNFFHKQANRMNKAREEGWKQVLGYSDDSQVFIFDEQVIVSLVVK